MGPCQSLSQGIPLKRKNEVTAMPSLNQRFEEVSTLKLRLPDVKITFEEGCSNW